MMMIIRRSIKKSTVKGTYGPVFRTVYSSVQGDQALINNNDDDRPCVYSAVSELHPGDVLVMKKWGRKWSTTIKTGLLIGVNPQLIGRNEFVEIDVLVFFSSSFRVFRSTLLASQVIATVCSNKNITLGC